MVVVAKVGRANGVAGLFQIGLETDYPERFHKTKEVHLYPNSAVSPVRRFVVESYQPRGSKHLLKLRGIDSPEEAKQLIHHWIAVPESEVVPLGEGEYYHYQLEGLSVIDKSDRLVGVLKEILSLPAHEIYVVQSDNGELLIPAVPAYIHDIDLVAKTVCVTVPTMDEGA